MCMQTSATAVSTHSQVRVYLVLLAPVLDWCGLVTSLVLERHVALSSHTDAFQRFQARGLNCLRASRKWDSRAGPPGPNGRATALQSSRLNTWRPRLCSSTLIDWRSVASIKTRYSAILDISEHDVVLSTCSQRDDTSGNDTGVSNSTPETSHTLKPHITVPSHMTFTA